MAHDTCSICKRSIGDFESLGLDYFLVIVDGEDSLEPLDWLGSEVPPVKVSGVVCGACADPDMVAEHFHAMDLKEESALSAWNGTPPPDVSSPRYTGYECEF